MHHWICHTKSWTSLCYRKKIFYTSFTLKVLNLQMSEGAQGDGHTDDPKLHGKPDKTLRFSLCSDNLEGISEGWSACNTQHDATINRPSKGRENT